MTQKDIETGELLLKEEFISKNPEWHKELELMIRTKEKAEIRERPAPLSRPDWRAPHCTAS